MCLEFITAELTPDDTPVTAWKVFAKRDDRFAFQYYGLDGTQHDHDDNDIIKLNEWMIAKNNKYEYSHYTTGFHAFENKHDANFWSLTTCGNLVVKEVQIRKIRIKGLQRGFRVLVADELYVKSDTSTYETSS